MYALLVMDMQEHFRPPASLCSEVDYYIWKNHEKDWPVLFSLYNGKGKLTDKICWSKSSFTFCKSTDDATELFVEGLQQISRTKNVRIVGLNTDGCVAKTACHLHDLGYNVTVVGKACASTHGFGDKVANHKYGLSIIKNHGVKIIHENG